MNYRQNAILPTEFRFAATCCRWAFAGGPADAILAGARHVDWDRFAAVARRHRVEGLVWYSLDGLGVEMPDAIADRLSTTARAIAEHGLRATAESARLFGAFDRAGIAILFFKGLTLGKLAYPSPFMKMSWDVDLLVPLARITDAADLLEEMGYGLAMPDPGRRSALAAWHERRKESMWVNADKGIHLELHGRLTENPRLLAPIGIGSPRQQVEVAPGVILPTLARDELFAYLAVHGAASGWHRLKWLADFSALLHGLDEDEIARLHAVSQALGAGRAAGQALLLASRLFDISIGEALEHRLSADRATRWLVSIALGQMAGRADLKEPTEIMFGTLGLHASHLLFAPGWKEKGLEFRRKLSVLLSNASGNS